MKIVFTHGREVSWPCSQEDLPEWKLAKLHAQVKKSILQNVQIVNKQLAADGIV